jgi:type I restriction enzyme S subunit
MSLARYAQYKDTGIEWLGSVPSHWNVHRLKTVASLVTEKATHRTFPVALENIESWSGRFIPSASEFEGEGVAFSAGDILFGKLRPYLAKVFLAERTGEAVGDFHVLRSTGKVLPRFLQYQILNRAFIDVIDGSTFGSKMPRANWESLGNMPLVLPPRVEQSSIATFLDHETAKIDALIAEQEKLIALLAEKRQATISQAVTKGLNPNAPMKDSGVAWLGKVPAHWEIVRIGTLFREMNQMGNDSLPVLSVSIHDGVSDKELSESELDRKVTRSEDKSKYKAVAPGDLAYNMMRAWQGGIGTVNVHGMVSPAYVVARPTRSLVTKYVEHLLRTPQAVTEMRRHSRGITDFRLRLYWDEFKMIRIALPPYEEQVQLARFIEREDKMLETLSASANQAITLLKERRSALIAAAVTGQIDVRASVTPPATQEELIA